MALIDRHIILKNLIKTMQWDLSAFWPRVPRVGWDFLLDKACFAYPLKKGTQTRSKENSFDAEQMGLLGYIEFAWIIINPICKVSLFRGVLTLAASVRFDFYGAKLGCKAKLCNMYFKTFNANLRLPVACLRSSKHSSNRALHRSTRVVRKTINPWALQVQA